jgi:uncharacterized protein
MTKRLFAALFAVMLILSVAILPASAEATYGYKLDDAADVLNANEESKLLSTIRDVSEKCKCNLAFVTVKDLNGASFSHNGTTRDYADMYYETAYGKNTDGIVVLLVLNNGKGKRDIYISTSGKCIKRLSDSERESIFDDALDNHSPDSKGYYDFLNAIAVDIKGAVVPHVKWYMLPLSFLIAFGIAMLILMFLKKQLKSVEMQRGAVNYVRPGSMNVTAARDSYLYSTVSRTARPKDSGSSSHTSSGGGTHGGGGRSF